jgi:hypothetical protein
MIRILVLFLFTFTTMQTQLHLSMRYVDDEEYLLLYQLQKFCTSLNSNYGRENTQ